MIVKTESLITVPRRPAFLAEVAPASSVLPDLPMLSEEHRQTDAIVRLFDPKYRNLLEMYPGDQQHQLERETAYEERGPLLDAGHRIVNGARLKLAETSLSGLGYQEARDYELLQDHGHGHERRWAKWEDLIILNSPELRITDERFFYALTEFANHDRDQLITEARNLSREQKGLPRLDPKLAHGPAGALRTMVLTPHYAEEAQISLKGAREIGYISGLMMMLHDDPEQLERALAETEIPNSKNRAYEVLGDGTHMILRGEKLMQAYKDGLDLLSLRPSQIAEITWRLKSVNKKGVKTEFVTRETPNGLDYHFEEELAPELDMIIHGNYQNLGEAHFSPIAENAEELPLGTTISDQFRKEFVLATRLAQFADQLDMVLPFRPAMMRKFWNHVSMGRPFFRGDLLERVLHGVASPVDTDGHSADSDLGRGLWEIVSLSDRIKPREGQISQSLSESQFISQLVQNIQVAAIMEQRRSGLILMSGNTDAIASLVKETFTTELLNITNKMLSRANILLVNEIDEKHPSFDPDTFFEQAVLALEQNGEREYADRLKQLQRENTRAFERTMECISTKMVTYSETEMAEFDQTCRALLREKFGKTNEEIDTLVENMEHSQLIELPYTTYYSSGDKRNARRYSEPPPSRRHTYAA